ncbi:TOMM precursor leader peptide-binding protein [Streptomyces sp. GD-15H]|uniref:TOMM precursor leader peptide-binding protein n=1 Tax=Streptomyces sp. GD-15H TaxID=3129112 RepID=UPI003249AB3F
MQLGLKQHVRVEVVPDEATYLLSEQSITAFEDPRVAVVAPLLDRPTDFRALVAAAAPRCSPADVATVVGNLHRSGLLHQGPAPAVDRAEAAYWELAGVPATRSADRVAVLAAGSEDAPAAARACAAAGLEVAAADDASSAALTLVVCDDYLSPGLADAAAELDARRAVWLPVKPHGTTVWIGPVHGPGLNACHTCLTHRLSGHRGPELYLRHALGRPTPQPAAETPASLLLGHHLAALECTKWLAGHRYPGQNGVLVLDTLSMSSVLHPLRARPQCPRCGDPGLVARRTLAPVTLRSRPKRERTGSGHRAVPAEETLRAFGHLVSPVTGVVKGIEQDRRGPAGLYAFRAGHNHALGPRSLTDPARHLRSESGGKGMTERDARAGALCEALERYSGMYQGDEPTIRAAWPDVADRAVHPDRCTLYDPRQGVVPFDESAPVDWTPVWSLTHGRHVLLPTALLYFEAPRTPGLGHVRADSNGNAAGSTLEDAVVQGFLELVERDAVALWWYNRTRHRAVDTASFDVPWTAEVEALHLSVHREVQALDVTSDFGIPVFAAISRRTDKPAEDVVLGFGAHFDAKVALCRALAEVNQMLPAVVEAAPDGSGYGCPDERLLDWWRTATVAGHPYLRPAEKVAPASAADFPVPERGDLLDDVHAAEQAVAKQGLELLVLDQTRPDIGLPVVKVMVPGMRHFWARFAPGRLFDIPVALGRLPRPTRYEDLNPAPLLL